MHPRLSIPVLFFAAILPLHAVADTNCSLEPPAAPEPACNGATKEIGAESPAEMAAVKAALDGLYDDSAWLPQAAHPLLEQCGAPLCLAYRSYFRIDERPQEARGLLACIANVREFIGDELELGEGECVPPLANFDKPEIVQLIVLLHGTKNEPEQDLPEQLARDQPAAIETLAVFGRYPPQIRGFDAASVERKLPEIAALLAFFRDIESGRWATTSYMPFAGSIIRDIGAHHLRMAQGLTYAPSVFLKESDPGDVPRCTNDCLEPLQVWGHRGLWNMTKLTKLEPLLGQAAAALERYYQSEPRLRQYALQARMIIERYTNERLGSYDGRAKKIAASRAYRLLSGRQLSVDELRKQLGELTAEEKDEALKLAALHEYPDEALRLLLTQGARVNVGPEPALMYGARNARIIKLLLEHGAEVDFQNDFGKTALFYAIQLDQPAAVEALVNAGSNVNHQLLDRSRLQELCERFGPGYEPYEEYLLEDVAALTPLAYALRYASPAIQSLLLRKKASLGPRPLEEIVVWLNQENDRRWTVEKVRAALATPVP